MTRPTPDISTLDPFVAASYEAVTKIGGLTPRAAQVELSNEVSNALLKKVPFIAEAPTGTGKTLAYLIGALSARRIGGAPIVVATATKALQQQLLVNDLPKLFSAGLLTKDDVAIAKGKSNYICARNAEIALDTLAQAEIDPETFLDDRSLKGSKVEITQTLTALQKGEWDGDFDAYGLVLSPATRRTIAVSTDTCIGKKCDQYRSCTYFKARAAVQGKGLVVTNHDLLLMDLLLSSDGGETTLGIADYFLVVDEAHHLPQKAIQVGSLEAPLTQLLLALPKLQGIQRLIASLPELKTFLQRNHFDESVFDKTASTLALRALIFELMDIQTDDSGLARFPGGKIPENLIASMQAVSPLLGSMAQVLGGVNTLIKEMDETSAAMKIKAKELQHRALDVHRLLTACKNCIDAFLQEGDVAKWMFRLDDSIVLHTAPLEGAQVLKTLFWGVSRIRSAVLVSATLQDVDGFSRYRKKVGAPASTMTKVLPHTFAYGECDLVVAGMEHSPKPAERKLFVPELKTKLPLCIDSKEGTLVIFPSWALLKEMVPTLKLIFEANRVKVQGELPLNLLLDAHRKDVDGGTGSILVGVATLSEGLDLPGDYCRHVIAVALPFAVPTTPVEQELAEQLGSKYFAERALPDAMMRLQQIVGRLIRRESDRGRVTLFDRRLASTGYGRQMLKSLPPFRIRMEPVIRL